jgi:predicted ATPase/DNA-binding SARP family transcriptional activator
MDEKVTYHQQVSYCGKPRCRRCREGIGHGPYWYAYRVVNGRTVRTYIGKELPPEIRATLEQQQNTPKAPPSPESVEEALIRIYTLGQFRLERRVNNEWQTVTDPSWQHQRVRTLLATLISSPHRKIGREQLLEILWPELDMEIASGRLDRAVYSLRQLFEPKRDRPATSPLLLTEREIITLAGQKDIWIDADAFEQWLNQARHTGDTGEKLHLLEEAANLYGGDFLPEERKIELTRMRREFLQRSWIGLLLELADLRAAQNPHSAIAPLDRVLAADPTNEAAVQRLMLLLAQLDRRGEALRVYKRLAAILQQEYHIAPLPETRNLYDTIRQGTAERLRIGGTGSATTGKPDTTREAPATVQIGRLHQSPLIGREQELNALQNLLTITEQNTRFKLPSQKRRLSLPLDTRRNAQAMLLMGDVGIGKTRLAEEIARNAQKGGWAIAWSRVYPQEISMPYRLWIEVLRKAMELGPWQRQELNKRPLIYQPLTTLLPELDILLSPVIMPPTQSAEQEQLRLWEAARELLAVISANMPLLIVLDDMQWADSSSCDLFAYLARHTQDLPIVIVGTCRENELTANQHLRALLTDLQREHAVEMLSLAPLSDEQIGAIVSHVPNLPTPIVQYIQSRAGGNPFFAEELARTMNQVAQEQPLTRMPALPDTISAVLNLRLSRLSNACQRLLGKAAVLGSSFEFHHISALEVNTPGYSEEGVLELIEEALQAGMLTEEGSGTRIIYQFWHPLLVTHLYESLSAARRVTYHRRTAEMLRQEFLGREEEGAAVITHHLVRGGAPASQTAHYAELAANRAYTLSAYPDAEHYYRLAIDYLQRTLQQNDTADPDEQLHLAYLLEFLGECCRLQGKYEEARRIYEQALQTRRAYLALVNPPEETPSLTAEEAQLQAMLLCEIGLTWYDTGDYAQARHYYEQGEQVLREAGVTTGPAWARLRFQQSYIDWREGNYDKALSRAQEALALFKATINQETLNIEAFAYQTRIRRTLIGDPVEIGRAQVLLGMIANGTGDASLAISYWNEALALFEQYNSQHELAIVACNLGDVYLRRAEYSKAQVFLRQSLGIAERIGDLQVQCVTYNNLGILAARYGNTIEAEEWYKKGLKLAEQMNDPVSVSILYTYLAQSMQDQGKFSEASKVLARSLSISRAIGIAPCTGFALVAAGELRLAQTIQHNTNPTNEEFQQDRPGIYKRYLQRAGTTLSHALTIEGMEAETRIEGQLAMAEVEVQRGQLKSAEQRARHILNEATRFELHWLLARAQRILGRILCARSHQSPQPQELQEEATRYFEQALDMQQKSGMRLEYARTLQAFGLALLRQAYWHHSRALQYLREALELFTACHATPEAQALERILIASEAL